MHRDPIPESAAEQELFERLYRLEDEVRECSKLAHELGSTIRHEIASELECRRSAEVA